MKPFIHNDWWDVLKPEFEKEYYQDLRKFLVEEYEN
ncbi:uracil-DNA glycosylase, partial [Enterococcus lactis]